MEEVKNSDEIKSKKTFYTDVILPTGRELAIIFLQVNGGPSFEGKFLEQIQQVVTDEDPEYVRNINAVNRIFHHELLKHRLNNLSLYATLGENGVEWTSETGKNIWKTVNESTDMTTTFQYYYAFEATPPIKDIMRTCMLDGHPASKRMRFFAIQKYLEEVSIVNQTYDETAISYAHKIITTYTLSTMVFYSTKELIHAYFVLLRNAQDANNQDANDQVRSKLYAIQIANLWQCGIYTCLSEYSSIRKDDTMVHILSTAFALCEYSGNAKETFDEFVAAKKQLDEGVYTAKTPYLFKQKKFDSIYESGSYWEIFQQLYPGYKIL